MDEDQAVGSAARRIQPEAWHRGVNMHAFGGFLVERGLVSVEALIDALDQQRAAQKPLGRLAVERRLLTMRQLFEILDRQLIEKNELFGDLAVAMGLITELQLSDLLEEQRRTRPAIGELLVRAGRLTRQALERELAAYAAR